MSVPRHLLREKKGSIENKAFGIVKDVRNEKISRPPGIFALLQGGMNGNH
jgi:hypothetical protein